MIIYKTTNLLNGKYYIGLDTRNNPNYLGSGKILKQAIRKSGRDNFKKEILEKCNTLEELRCREIYWILYYNSRDSKVGYNIAEGGKGGDTFTHHPDKEDIRKKLEGRVPWNKGIKTETPGTFTGKTHKESSKELMRKAKEGKYIGKDSPTYGTGRQIIELSTGFVGYMYDQQKQFNIPGNTSIYKNIKKGKPFVIGKNKGLQFSFLEDRK
jgi:hypothetical protein